MPALARSAAPAERGRAARYRVLGAPLARALAERYDDLPRATIARRLGVSVPTLRKLVRGAGTINRVTVERIARVLHRPPESFAVASGDPARPVVPALIELPSNHLDHALRWFGANPLLARFLGEIGRTVHWQHQLVDEARPYRLEFAAPSGLPVRGGYVEWTLAADGALDLIVSYRVAGPGDLGLAIDVGALRADGTEVRAWELIARRAAVGPRTAGAVTFLAWVPAGDVLLVRADGPCRLAGARAVADADAEARLDGHTAGLRALGGFHVASAPPWSAVTA